jgi:hypothetical protein
MGTSLLFAGCGDNSGTGTGGSPASTASASVTNAGGETPSDFIPTPYSEEDLELRLHNGGAGGAAYVVHFTEQEALGIVRARLEEAGLRFGTTPPNIKYPHGDTMIGAEEVKLDLFDADKNVAVASINWEKSNQRFTAYGEEFAGYVTEHFKVQMMDTHFGVFYSPGVYPQFDIDMEDIWEGVQPQDDKLEESKAVARPKLKAELHAQVDRFVEFLQSEGVL